MCIVFFEKVHEIYKLILLIRGDKLHIVCPDSHSIGSKDIFAVTSVAFVLIATLTEQLFFFP